MDQIHIHLPSSDFYKQQYVKELGFDPVFEADAWIFQVSSQASSSRIQIVSLYFRSVSVSFALNGISDGKWITNSARLNSGNRRRRVFSRDITVPASSIANVSSWEYALASLTPTYFHFKLFVRHGPSP